MLYADGDLVVLFNLLLKEVQTVQKARTFLKQFQWT